MSAKKGNRQLAMDSLKAVAKKVRNGVYFVKRGAIVWGEFAFDKHARAISIQMDERDFMKATNRAECALEFAAAIPGTDEIPEIDDGLMEEFADDAEAILKACLADSDSVGNFILGFAPGKMAEFHDVDIRVQGLIVKFTIDF